MVSPNPAQGSSQTLTASVHFATVAVGTPITFSVTGANVTSGIVNTNASGNASFSYVGVHEGVDNVTASTSIAGQPVSSSPASVTWASGLDVTFVSLNQSPKGAIEGQSVSLVASLTDVSQNPAALSGQEINFSAGGQTCEASTNAQGVASCSITASGTGIETLSATFAGTGSLVASSASDGFNVITTPATPTATPTPVPGKLKVEPKELKFGDVAVGDSATKSVEVINAGKIKKKKVPLPILIEMESGVTSPFTITQACIDDDIGPKGKGIPAGSCKISVNFAPTAAMKYEGTLTINDNLEPSFEHSVKLEGSGTTSKK